MKTADETSVNDWEDDRGHSYLALRYPANDNDDRHRPVMAPANDNRYGSWIERDEAGRPIRVVRGIDRGTRCYTAYRADRGSMPPVRVTAATLARTRLDEWRRNNPQTDSHILPRAPRNQGGHALTPYAAELMWWREMTNSPTVWDGMVREAENDNEPSQEERENEEERPSVNEIVASLPLRIRDAMAADIMPTDVRILTCDIEWKRGRIARLGNLYFATATRHVPDEPSESSNASGAVVNLPRAGELVRFRPEGRRGWSRPTVHAREHRNGQGDRNSSYLYLLETEPRPSPDPNKQKRWTDPAKTVAWLHAQGLTGQNVDVAFRRWLRSQDFGADTRYPTGLPFAPKRLRHLFMSGRTVPGAGTKDGAGSFDRVRAQDEIEGQVEDDASELDLLGSFRDDYADEAAILDRAMTAQNLEEIARAAHASSPHTGRRLLVAACVALRNFRQKNSANLQFLPTRAA